MSIKLNKVTIHDLKSILMLSIGNAFINGTVAPNIMITGSPGVGKSSAVYQAALAIAQKIGYPVRVIDVRLSCMEYSEVQGIPHNADSGDFYLAPDGTYISRKEMIHSRPAWFPVDATEYTILFFDELTNCSPSVQHAAYRILLDRTIQNGDKLPDTCAIVAAGNLKSDKTGAKSLMAAAANRFAIHLEIDNDRLLESFIDYAFENNFKRSLIAYLQWKPTALNEVMGSEDAFPSPRSWEYVNGHLDVFDKSDYLNTVIAGAIGTAGAIDYEGFREYDGLVPDFKKIRKGEIDFTFEVGAEQVKWAASTGITYEIVDMLRTDLGALDEDEFATLQNEMGNIVKLLDQLPQEMQIVLFRGLSKQTEIVAKIFKFNTLRSTYSAIANYVSKHIR